MNEKQRAWVVAATKFLTDAGSWTGRTHLHKHLFIAHALNLANIPFDFELYHYGPYSFELDNVIAEMEAFGDLDKRYRRAGYGPSYETTSDGDEAIDNLNEKETEIAEATARCLAHYDSADLELIATCLYVQILENEEDIESIALRVKEIKPKYSISQIQSAIDKARDVRENLGRLQLGG